MKKLEMIDINKIIANPYQPRNYFDKKSISELANSIKQNGLIQPISVREKENQYEIVVGERRFRALQELGYEKIEVYILDDDESGSMNKALIENIQRENLSAIEEARAYLKIMHHQQITQKELAKQIGKSQPSIANKIRLLGLNVNIQNAIESKLISERHARALLSLDEKQQNEVLESILKNSLTVDQAEKKIKGIKVENKLESKTKGFSRNVHVSINTIKQAFQMVEKTGTDIQMNMNEEDEFINIHLKIKK